MISQTFRTTLLSSEAKTATGFKVPPKVVEALGAGKRPAVTVNGYTYRHTVAPFADGVFMIGVSAEHRAASGLKAGDDLDVTLALDTAPRVVEVPPELASALEADATARAFFDGLSYSKVAACLARPTVRRGAPSFAEPKSLVDAARLQWLAPPMY